MLKVAQNQKWGDFLSPLLVLSVSLFFSISLTLSPFLQVLVLQALTRVLNEGYLLILKSMFFA